MPPTALTAPMAITTIAQVVPAGAARSKKTSIRPKTATLSIAPESIAEPFGGATGCARGNQKWSGNSPALDPNPNSASPNAALPHPYRPSGAFQTATAIVSTPSSAKNGEANGTRPQSKTNPGTIEPT